MDRRIEEFFEDEKIEYFAAIDYRDLREINPRLVERHGMTPKSAIIFLLPYYAGETENLSLYAASRDYHILVNDITGRLVSLLSDIYPEYSFLGFGDHSPIDERSAALKAGLGILGDNGLLINEKYGTYVFLADVISDIPPEIIGAINPLPVSRCEGCGACKMACPTGILAGKGTDCLSAITQKKGELTESEAELMIKYDTVWGCDICQTVCPHNVSVCKTPIEFFKVDRIECIDSDILNSMSDEKFKERAFAWRGKNTVKRNIEILEQAKMQKCKL